MDIRYFDAHSHLNFSQYDSDRDTIIARMRTEGVATITVGTNIETSQEAVVLAHTYEHLFATVGVHPTDWEKGFDREAFQSLTDEKKVVAVGECGLDYFRSQEGKEEQRALFETHITLAQEANLPLMIHGRPSKGTMDAYEDILDILKGSLADSTGDVHFFVGNTEIARRFLEQGFTVSFDGPITFTHDYDEVVQYVPADMLLAETDAPFAAPEPYRGTRNEPLYVKEVVKALARIRNEDEEKLRTQLITNVLRVFPRILSGTMES